MSLKWGMRASALLLACCTAAAWADEPMAVSPAPMPADAPGCACATGGCATGACGRGSCHCPKTCFTIEKPPCLKWHKICPKPVCSPCDLEGYGYYPTCWRPWAYPPNYAYCPVPPPGVVASEAPPLIVGEPGPASPGAAPDETLPSPKKAATPNPDR
ncbi:MAG TPA: hypothetical protein VMS17_20335 [Gemmataceae bacterium]|nr:hypothetical protein [Gemmataceae bacterium]